MIRSLHANVNLLHGPLDRIVRRLFHQVVVDHSPGHGRPAVIELPDKHTTAAPLTRLAPIAPPRFVRCTHALCLDHLRQVRVSADIVLDLEILRDVCYETALVTNSFVMKIHGHGARATLGGICDHSGYGFEMGVCSKAKFGHEAASKLVCLLVLVHRTMPDCSSVRSLCVGKHDGIGLTVPLMDITHSRISCGL